MNLVVFDLDGTLTRTNAVDGECFVQAIKEALQVESIDRNWSGYEHVTDDGVTQALFVRHRGRHPAAEETGRIVDRFMDLLGARHTADASDFSEIPGASPLLRHLLDESGWAVALATGAWRRSAEFKIQRAALPISSLPSAFSEDGPSREAIVLSAIERAAARYRQSRFDRVISVGDALWDVKTARSLGLPFLGIAGGRRASLLRDNGASHVIEDYCELDQCLRLLQEAQTP